MFETLKQKNSSFKGRPSSRWAHYSADGALMERTAHPSLSLSGRLSELAESSVNKAELKLASRSEQYNGYTYLAGKQPLQGRLGGHGGAGVTGGGGGGDGGGGGVMALLDEIRQQVNTACEAISVLVAQSRTVTRARTQTRPGNQSNFLCYTLESKTVTAEAVLSAGESKGARGPATNYSDLHTCLKAESAGFPPRVKTKK